MSNPEQDTDQNKNTHFEWVTVRYLKGKIQRSHMCLALELILKGKIRIRWNIWFQTMDWKQTRCVEKVKN